MNDERRGKARGQRLLLRGIVFALLSLPLLAQPRIVLKELQIKFDAKTPISAKTYQKQYQDRLYTSQLPAEIQTRLLEDLKKSGYFFSEIDSSTIRLDSTRSAAFLYLGVATGKRLRLNTITVQNPDSLSAAMQRKISERCEEYRGRYYTELLVNYLFEEIVTILENAGYPLARVRTGEFKLSESDPTTESTRHSEWLLDLSLEVLPGDSVQVAYLRFPRQKSNLTTYLQRLLRFQPGQGYEERRVSRYVQTLRRQEFVRQVQEPVLARDQEEKYFLNIEFEETPAVTFDGIIGYIPPPANQAGAKGYFTGLINIGVRNLFGGGRKLQVFWQKQDRLSDEFRLAYREPFLFGLPFHTQLGMNRLVRDTTYIEWKYQVNFEFPINEALSAFVSAASRNVAPDSLASRRLRLPQTASLVSETGIRWDLRDDLQNPRKGLELLLAFSLNRQKNKGPEYLLNEDSLKGSLTQQRVRATFDLFIPTFKRQLLANRFHAELVESRGEALRPPDQVWFGGATTVRGFREAQFFAKRVFWANTEYRFILAPRARFFVFSDNAYFMRDYPDKINQWLNSYGLGLRFEGPLGIFQLDYGLEKGAPFQEGKLHFRLINEF